MTPVLWYQFLVLASLLLWLLDFELSLHNYSMINFYCLSHKFLVLCNGGPSKLIHHEVLREKLIHLCSQIWVLSVFHWVMYSISADILLFQAVLVFWTVWYVKEMPGSAAVIWPPWGSQSWEVNAEEKLKDTDYILTLFELLGSLFNSKDFPGSRISSWWTSISLVLSKQFSLGFLFLVPHIILPLCKSVVLLV
jgi:hypothetical protein